MKTRGNRFLLITMIATVLLVSLISPIRAIDQAMQDKVVPRPTGTGNSLAGSSSAAGAPSPVVPTAAEITARERFRQQINLDPLRTLSVQHRDVIKTLDSWARQNLSAIRHRQTIDGEDPLYVALDITFRPDAWADRNIFYIQAIPIREQLQAFAVGASAPERQKEAYRILHEGLVSYNFLSRQDVQSKLEEISQIARQTDAVGKVMIAQSLYERMLSLFTVIPPSTAENFRTTPWHHPFDLFANLPVEERRQFEDTQKKVGASIPGYSVDDARRLVLALQQLGVGWNDADAQLVNRAISTFATTLPSLNQPIYPTQAKRTTELWYNRTFNGTIVAFVYFFAMVLFLLNAVGVTTKVEKLALTTFGIALALHITAMGIRWWLAGRIPIQNQFESVLGSALFGCIVGFILESWKRNGIFGLAFSFVGFLAMTACFAAPYVFGNDLGGSINFSHVAGILVTYWLYIHVNIVIGSYALISASFVIGVIYLLTRQWHWINPIEPGFSASTGDSDSSPKASGRAGTAVAARTATSTQQLEASRAQTLETLDQANMVVLQMAMWMLGIGIICGAIWADRSWGRPWGWDPKETFALVTWIVYLIIVHVRLVTKARADLTAWLSVAGFGIMMFNWIGVNFFLAGLHSYA